MNRHAQPRRQITRPVPRVRGDEPLDELGKTGEVPADVLARVIKAAYDL